MTADDLVARGKEIHAQLAHTATNGNAADTDPRPPVKRTPRRARAAKNGNGTKSTPPPEYDSDGIPYADEPPAYDDYGPADDDHFPHDAPQGEHQADDAGPRKAPPVNTPPGRTLNEDEYVAGATPSGQLKMANGLAHIYNNRLLYVHGIGWHTWDNTRWIYDDTGAANRAVYDILKQALLKSIDPSLSDADRKKWRRDAEKCESATGVRGVLELSAALTPFAATVRGLDPDPHLLNCANGTLDLHTLTLRPHSPTDRITKVCRGAYTESQSPLWESFLERVLPDESVRGYIQRLVGLSLLGAVRENILTIFTGTGANGKSVIDRVIRWALGDYAITAEPDLFMHREGAHPTGELDLLGARWVSVAESEKDRRLAEATMKRLTGGDRIRARKMRQDFVEFDPSHVAILITNHLPKVSGDDPAIWRRIRVVPFDVTIPSDEQDPELGERLELEADAILSWAIQGWRDYQERGLAEPPAVLEATDRYQRASDAIARFISDRCHIAPAVKSTTTPLFEAFEKWRTADGAEPLSEKAFGHALDAKGYPASRPSNGKRWRNGIALQTEPDTE